MTDSEVLHSYLQCRGIKMPLAYLNRLLITHPDFPTLISFVDTLEGLGIGCYAVKLEKGSFNKIEYPFLAVTPERANIFEIVHSAEQLDNDIRNIFQAWNGMVVFVEEGAGITDQDYWQSVYKQNKISRAAWAYLSAVVLLLLVFTGMRLNIEGLLFLTISLAGLALTLSIIQQENGANNVIYNALCNAPRSINCNLVLNSNLSSIKKLALSDITLIYFLFVILYIFLVATNGSDNGIVLLLIPALTALICTLVLLGYQKLVIKTWCNVCLSITAIIWIQGFGLILYFVNRYPFYEVGLDDLILFLTSALISSSYFYLKPYLLATEKLRDDEITLLKWKRNPEIFSLILKQQMKIEYQENPHTDVFFGDENSEMQLIVVLKPFCTLCADAFNAICKLASTSISNIRITVRFAVNPHRLDDRRSAAVVQIISACKGYNNKLILSEWFEEMDLKKWEAKHGHSNENKKQQRLELGHHFTYAETPAVFINKYKLPEQYEISDLNLLLPHLSS